MRRITLLVLFFLNVSLTYGQHIVSLSVDNGLANMIVRSTTQDATGIVWFATNWGVQSYDGSRFKEYNISDITNGDWLDNRFIIVSFDKYNRLWAATRTHLMLYDRQTDGFDVVFSLPHLGHTYAEINEIHTPDSLNVYLSSTRGLFHFMFSDPNSCKQVTNTSVNSYVSLDEKISILATSIGVTFWNSAIKEEIRHIPLQYQKLSQKFKYIPIRKLRTDNNHNVWIITERDGVFIFTKNGEIIEPDWNDMIRFTPVRDIIHYNNQYMIGADGLGVLFCNERFEITDILKSDDNANESLSNDGIYDLNKDSDGRVWISTFGGGINIYDPNIAQFKSIYHRINTSNSLANNNTRAIFEDSQRNIWFGTKNGVSLYNPEQDSWTHLNKQTNLALHSNTILAFTEDADGNVWVSTYAGGVSICDKQLNIKRKITTSNSNLGSDDIFALFRDKDGDIWLSGENEILSCYDHKTKKFKQYIVDNVVRCIIQSRDGRIIISGSKGVQYVDKSTGKISKPIKASNHKDNNLVVYSVVEDAQRNLWMATEGEGLKYFNIKNNSILTYDTTNGLSSNVIYALVLDDLGNLWMSSSKGLMNYKNGTFLSFTSSSGVNTKEFIYGAYAKLASGEILFGGSKGAIRFNPKTITVTKKQSKLIFTEFRLFNRPVYARTENSPLKKAINESPELTLTYDENSFSFDFTTVDLINSSQNKYSWKLEGLEDEWSPTSNSGTASYTNIPSGKYVFRVRTSIDFETDNISERSIKIRILPSIWQTVWAYIFYFLIIVAVAIVVINMIRSRVSAHQAKDKINFFVDIAHDIKTPLSLIHAPLVDIRNSTNLNKEQMHELDIAIKNSNRLTKLISQLLDFEKTSSGGSKMRIGKYRIEPTIKLLSQTFDAKIKQKNIELLFDIPESPTWAWFDMDKFEKIVVNILDNAFKYTEDNGRVMVRSTIEDKNCCIEISDTGIGIPDLQKQNIFKRYFRATNAVNSRESGSGVGLLLSYELMNQMGGKISFTSKEGVGTAFRLLFPLGKSHIITIDNASEEILVQIIEPPLRLNNSDSKQYKVIIAEDNPELLTYICEHIEPYYTTYPAANGQVAIDIMRDITPDIIITDFMMPHINGIELCNMVKNSPQWCHIPIVMLTALTAAQHRIEAFNAGVDSYIDKPVDINVLLSRVDNLLNRNRNIQSKAVTEGGNEQEPIKVDNELFNKINKVILDHLSDSEFMVDDICVTLGLSYSVLYRKLKDFTDLTPVDFIKEARIKKAAELIATSSYNISEIAYMTGFTQPNYFSKVFKAVYGCTPADYRRKNK